MATENNQSTIDVIDSTVNLYDTLTMADLGTFNRAGNSTINLRGTLNQPGLELDLDTASNWRLLGGRINGGTITTSDDTPLVIADTGTNSDGVLDGVTVNTDVTVSQGVRLTVVNGLTLNGTATLYRSSGSGGESFDVAIFFSGGRQTLDGAGEVVFNNTGRTDFQEQYVRILPTSGAELIIGPDMTIRDTGFGGTVGSGSYSLINRGTISARQSGRTLRVTGSTVTNEGTLESQGGTLDVNGLIGVTGDIRPANGGTVDLGGFFTVNQDIAVGDNGSHLVLRGTWLNDATLQPTGAQLTLTGTQGTNRGTIIARDGSTVTINPSEFISSGVIESRELSQVSVSNLRVLEGTINVASGGDVIFEDGLKQERDAVVNVQIDGPGYGEFGHVIVKGGASLNGAIIATFDPNYELAEVNSFPLVQYDSLVSRFREVDVINLPPGLLADPQYYLNHFNIGQQASRFVAAGGGAWTNAENWMSRQLPGIDSDVLIDIPGSYSVTVDSPVSIASLYLGSDVSGRQSLLVSSQLALTEDDIEVLSGGDIILTNGTLNADVASSGRLFARGTSEIDGDLTVADSGSVFVQGVSGLSGAVFTVADGISNHGHLELTGTSSFTHTGDDATLIVTGGRLINEADGVIRSIIPGGASPFRLLTAEVDNRGTIQIDSTLTIDGPEADHLNSGTINVAGGNLTINQSGNDPGLTNTGN